MSSPSDLNRSYNSSVRVTSAWLNAINSRLLNEDGSDWRRWTDADLDVSPGSLFDRVAKISDQLHVQAGMGLSVSVSPGRVGLSDGTTLEVGNMATSTPASLTLADDSNLFVYVSASGLGFGETLPSGALLLAVAQTAGGILVSLEDRRSLFAVFGDSEGAIGDRLDSLEAGSDTLDGAITTINQSLDTIDGAITDIQSSLDFSGANDGDFVRVGSAGELVTDSLVGGQIESISDAVDTLTSGLAGLETALDFAGATTGDFIRIDSLGNLAAQTTNLGVMSVGLTAPSVFTVSNSPVTGSGSLTFSFASGQTANQFLATPNGATGAIALRSIVADDIPSLNASKITSGVFGAERIPNLDSSKITTGVLALDRIPDLAASKITTGAFSSDRIPSLDASKITTGLVATNRLASGTASASTYLRGDQTWQAISGVATALVQASPPTSTTNAALGTLIFCTSDQELYVCIDATTNANQWRFWISDGSAGTIVFTASGSPVDGSGMEAAANQAFFRRGALYYLGTTGLTQAYSNIHTSSRLVVTMSSIGTGAAVNAVDRTIQQNNTADSAGSWIRFDFGTRTFAANRIVWQHGTTTGINRLQSYKYQGSNDASTSPTNWTDIATYTNSPPANTGYSFKNDSFVNTTAFRHYRILSTGVDSSGSNFLAITDVEFFGTATDWTFN